MKLFTLPRILLYSIALSAIVFTFFFMQSNPASPLMVHKSPHSFKHTVNNIRKAVKSNNFKIIRESRGPDIHTIYFCNFSVAYEAIKKDDRIGFTLPCRVTIIKKENKVLVTALNPKKVAKFTHIKLGSLCTQIKDSIINILEEALI